MLKTPKALTTKIMHFLGENVNADNCTTVRSGVMPRCYNGQSAGNPPYGEIFRDYM